ncbi:unnamed protein product [Phytomonas sp. EM1]|nr:unnamed protein product [Phytomonas sp. EM1]|eukprot:CCW63381.1 unnamed protein product [Phytomonas sp. isolate EM1]
MSIPGPGLGANTVISSTAPPSRASVDACDPCLLPMCGREHFHRCGYRSTDSDSGGSDKRKEHRRKGASHEAQQPFKGLRVPLLHMMGGSFTIDRNSLAVGRLSTGFLADPYKNLKLLLQEGIDREAYIVFRYGLIMAEHLFGGVGGGPKVPSDTPAVVVPITQAVPGFLQLLAAEREQRRRSGSADTPLSATDGAPKKGGGDVATSIPGPFGRSVVGLPGRLPTSSSLLSPLMRHMVPDGGPEGQPTQELCAAIGSLRELMLRAMGWLGWSKDSASQAEVEAGGVAKKQRPHGLPTPPIPTTREPPHRAGAATTEEGDPATPPSLKSRRGGLALYFIEGDGVGLSSLQEAIERRVAVLVLLERFEEASELLALYASFHPLYPNIALELSAVGTALSVPHATSEAPRSVGGLREEMSSVRLRTMGCTYWLSLALYFIDTFVRPARAGGEAALSRTAQRKSATPAVKPGGGEAQATATTHPGKPVAQGARPPDRLRYYFQILELYPRLPLSDVLALGVLILLPPKYTTADIDLTIRALRILVDQQYDSAPRRRRGAADGLVHPPTSPMEGLLRDYPGRCSLLLTATVEEATPESPALQRYVDETADVQGPLGYITAFGETRGVAYPIWREAYRARLNAHGYGVKRCEYDLSTIKMLTARGEASSYGAPDGLFAVSGENSLKLPLGLPGIAGFGKLPAPGSALGCMMKQTFGTLRSSSTAQVGRLPGFQSALPGNPRRGVELRCNCGQPMHTTAPSIGAVTQTVHCRKQPMPCGNSECTQGQTPMCVVCGERMEPRMTELPPERSFVWCTVCLHGGHWCDMQAWFAKHTKCPVENCPCNCCDGKTL